MSFGAFTLISVGIAFYMRYKINKNMNKVEVEEEPTSILKSTNMGETDRELTSTMNSDNELTMTPIIVTKADITAASNDGIEEQG